MKKEKANVEETQTERRVNISLPETFILGVLLAVGIASAKAIVDVRSIKEKQLQPVIKLERMEKKIDDLDSKFDYKIDKIYELLLLRGKNGK